MEEPSNSKAAMPPPGAANRRHSDLTDVQVRYRVYVYNYSSNRNQKQGIAQVYLSLFIIIDFIFKCKYEGGREGMREGGREEVDEARKR